MDITKYFGFFAIKNRRIISLRVTETFNRNWKPAELARRLRLVTTWILVVLRCVFFLFFGSWTTFLQEITHRPSQTVTDSTFCFVDTAEKQKYQGKKTTRIYGEKFTKKRFLLFFDFDFFVLVQLKVITGSRNVHQVHFINAVQFFKHSDVVLNFIKVFKIYIAVWINQSCLTWPSIRIVFRMQSKNYLIMHFCRN